MMNIFLVSMLATGVASAALMIFSKKNAGKWVATKGKRIIAVDAHLSGVLKKVKSHDQDSLQLAFIPKTRFLAGFHAL